MNTARIFNQPNAAPARSTGFAEGTVRHILQLEGLALLIAACAGYALVNGSWSLFAWLFLAPDLAMLGYLVNRPVGTAAYNTMHSTVGPVALGLAGLSLARPLHVALALVWAAHIGFDRMLGFGLKYPTAFGDSHLGPFGRTQLDG